MESPKLVHIQISRIIPAENWRVIRMLTKVSKFSDNVLGIKEVKVLKKMRNVILTQWNVVLDDLPIFWIEEDVFSLRENTIYFKAIEGDLEQFKGTWRFDKHSNGTQVVLDVYLKVGIPSIEQFADGYVKKLVERIFISILDFVEMRLISIKYKSLENRHSKKIAGFGILGHFYNLKHLQDSLQMLNPDFKMPSKEFLSQLFKVTPSFKMHEMDEFKSKTGDTTHGSFIMCTFIPDMMDSDIEGVYSKVVRACKLAEKQGVGIVTLGGFASIVGERFGRRITEDVDIPITTGNTYTAALAIDGVEKAAELLGKDIKDLKIAIIGGTGDIGSACARVLSQKARQVTITGRTQMNLYLLKYALKKESKAKIIATTNNMKAVRDADIIIAAANSSAAILKMEWFKPGSIICDLGYPKNLSYNETERKDIFVFSGGLASLPTPIDTGVNMGVPSSDVCYGCFCEVIILALEHRFENYSIGRGKITPEKIDEIHTLGIKHGFELAPFFWADKVHEEDAIGAIKKAMSHV